MGLLPRSGALVSAMDDAVIVEALRTPVGRRRGRLAGWHPVDLAAEVVRAVVERSGIDPASVDDVIVGCVDQVGEQAINVARSIALAAGLPETVPATTVDRQCGSSQQAAHFAAQGVMAGAYDIVIAAGVESMTRVPMFANAPDRSEVYGPRFRARYGAGRRRFHRPGHLRGDRRRAVGRDARADGPIRRRVAPQGPAGHRGGALRGRDRADRGDRRRRRPWA